MNCLESLGKTCSDRLFRMLIRMDSLVTAQIFAVLSVLAFSAGSLTSRYGLRTSTPLTSTLILGLVTLGIYGPIALATSPAWRPGRFSSAPARP